MVMKTKGGYQFGNNPPTTKEKAFEEMQAAYANGYKGGREHKEKGKQ